MTKDETKIKLEAIEGHRGCPAHEHVVDVLLSFDKKLNRITVILIIAAAAAVGGFGKEVILPLLLKMVGA
jgi:hypothetical protein